MRSLAAFALSLGLTAAGVAKVPAVEQAQIENFYYKIFPTGAYVNYVTFSVSTDGIYTTCTRDGSVLTDVYNKCDDNRVYFRLDKDTANIYVRVQIDGCCLSGQSSFSPSGTGDGWIVPSIGIQLSDQGDLCF
ncbi:hypothetical protein B0J12DRAFT_788178 [Macrophomina phaseolina]|uniref:Uncharacterized protein n=1 Tax=Macrophomina phaseolina TaxID=35725 RepID=A0ABQ8G1Y3_9PEZI|nr:hypothetical protein B0J12DRAFT_788178 [Macrophomina phaseolina]